MGENLALTLDLTVLANSANQGSDFSEQVSSTLEYNTGPTGRFGVSLWMNFGGAVGEGEDLDDRGMQEADVGPYWSIYSEPLRADFRVGWLWQFFPNSTGSDAGTNQGPYASAVFDDSGWFGTDRPVLTPSVAWFQDVDDDPGALVGVGLSHFFLPVDLGLGEDSALKHFSLTPSLLVVTSIDRYGDGTRLASIIGGVSVAYDLGSAMSLPVEYGSPILSAFVNYCDGKVDEVPDQWYGGLTLGLRW